MQTITSVQNPIVKLAASLHQRKNRDTNGLFLIEGKKGVEEAIKAGINIKYIFIAAPYETNSVETILTNEKILKKISTTDSPSDIVAIAKQFKHEIKDLFREEKPLIIVLDGVKDPGNLGTIIRTACAANASGIILTGDTADIFNPKVVRSSVGNLWKIPIVEFKDKSNLKETINSYKPCQIIGTSSHEENKTLFQIDLKKPTAIIFGSEAEGMTVEVSNQTDFSIKIPINPEVESLNLSVSTGVVLYEALRQRG